MTDLHLDDETAPDSAPEDHGTAEIFILADADIGRRLGSHACRATAPKQIILANKLGTPPTATHADSSWYGTNQIIGILGVSSVKNWRVSNRLGPLRKSVSWPNGRFKLGYR